MQRDPRRLPSQEAADGFDTLAYFSRRQVNG